MKKDNVFKQAARWVAKMFGYKAESKLGRIVWHVFATGAAIIVVIVAVRLINKTVEKIKYDRAMAKLEQDEERYLDDYSNFYVSPYVIHHDGYPSYLYSTKEGRRTITGIQWICKSADDSLTVFSHDDKRGYFNMYTGKPVIPAQYEKAWVFSEGVAWVMKQGELHLIDHDGKDVIKETFPFNERIDSYCFHNGLCPMVNDEGRIGFINKKGEWVIDPTYYYVNFEDVAKCWMVIDFDDLYGTLDLNGEIMIPVEYSFLYVEWHGDYIAGRRTDHVDVLFDIEGNIVNPFSYERVEKMEYETDEMYYDDHNEAYFRKTAAANLWYYITSDYYCGLMDKQGNIITLPLYNSIIALSANMYLCENEDGAAVILDDKGKVCGTRP